MTTPDPQRVGGLAWAQRTKGRLTATERRRLLGPITAAMGTYVAGRIRAATGRVPAGARNLDAGALTPPDSALARTAEAACTEQPPSIIGHSYRTWMFGAGLAALDGSTLDRELFYVACLLHDYGISEVVAGEGFTLRSAGRLQRCADNVGLPMVAVEPAADAITVHAAPGIEVGRDGALGVYVQAGAMFDLTGLRVGDVSRAYREQVIAAHSRAGVTTDLLAVIKSEAAASPDGRFALLQRCGLPLLLRLNPIRPR